MNHSSKVGLLHGTEFSNLGYLTCICKYPRVLAFASTLGYLHASTLGYLYLQVPMLLACKYVSSWALAFASTHLGTCLCSDVQNNGERSALLNIARMVGWFGGACVTRDPKLVATSLLHVGKMAKSALCLPPYCV